MVYKLLKASGTEMMRNGKDVKRCRILAETTSGMICLDADLDMQTERLTFCGTAPDDLTDPVRALYLVQPDKSLLPVDMEPDTHYDPSAEKIRGEFVDEIPDVPWQPGFSIGSGLDAITNMIHQKGVCVKQEEPTPDFGMRTERDACIVQTSTQFESLLTTELSGQYTYQDFKLNGAFEYLNAVRYSENTLSIILRERIYELEYPGTRTFTLTDEAKQLAKDSPKQFRDVYGDYFIADMRKGAYFIAVYRCEANSSEQLQKFQMSLATETNLFNLSTESKFKKLLTENKIRLNVQFYCHGCKGIMPYEKTEDALDVSKALAWFSNNVCPVPLYAKLVHYACLPGSGLKKQIPYDATTLLKVKTLFASLWHLKSDALNIHPNYYELTNRIAALADEITLRLPEILQQPAKADAYRSRVRALQAETSDLLCLQKVYSLLKTKKPNEPKPFEKNRSSEQVLWEFGCFQCPHMDSYSVSVSGHGSGAGYCKEDIAFPPKGRDDLKGKTVIGYRVRANWTDHSDGDWWKLSDQGLLDHMLLFHINSYWGRGYDWTCDIYFVDDKYMNF